MLIDPHLSAWERDRVLQGCCQLRQGPQTGLAAGLPTSGKSHQLPVTTELQGSQHSPIVQD